MLSNKVAIVTGGARGIGRATAIELARHGADVAICDVCARAAAEDRIREIEALGRKALFIQADVANRTAVESLIAETVGRFGRIDILVNNAARSIRKPLLELEIGDVEAATS